MSILSYRIGDGQRLDVDVLSALIATLSHGAASERQKARRALSDIGRQAVPFLIQALSSGDTQLRWQAARVLRRIRDPIAATALVSALEDRDPNVRWAAAQGVTVLGREGLTPLLAALIQRAQSSLLRAGARHVFWHLGKSESCAVVRPVLAALERTEATLTVPLAAYAALYRLRAASK